MNGLSQFTFKYLFPSGRTTFDFSTCLVTCEKNHKISLSDEAACKQIEETFLNSQSITSSTYTLRMPAI